MKQLLFWYIGQIVYYLLLAVLLVSIVFLVKWNLSRKRMYELAEQIPKPNFPSLPIIGHALHLKKLFRDFPAQVSKFEELQATFATWLGPVLIVFTGIPEDIDRVLNSSLGIHKGLLYKCVSKGFKGSFIIAPVSQWKPQRRLITAIFRSKPLESYLPITNRYFNKIILDWQKETGTITALDRIIFYSVKTDTDIITGTLIDDKSTNTLIDSIHSATKIVSENSVNILEYVKFGSYFNRNYITLQTHITTVMLIIKNLVTKRKEEISKEICDSALVDSERFIYLDWLLNSKGDGKAPDDMILEDHLKFLILSAYETTGKTTSFLLLVLGMRKDVQDKIYAEAKRVIKNIEEIEEDELSQLNYFEKVIFETLRLFPPVAFIARKVAGDIHTEKFTIPKDTEVVINIFGMHRSPKLYKDPLTFDPERFSAEEMAKRHKMAFLPFSTGPRDCIGKHFAMHLMKMLVAKVVWNFEIDTPLKSIDEIKLDCNVFLDSTVGYPIQLKSRQTP